MAPSRPVSTGGPLRAGDTLWLCVRLGAVCSLHRSLSLCAPCPNPVFLFLGPFTVRWPGGASPRPRGHGGVEAGRPGEGRRSLREWPTRAPDHPDPRPPGPQHWRWHWAELRAGSLRVALWTQWTHGVWSAGTERRQALALRPVQLSAGLLTVSVQPSMGVSICTSTLLLPVSLRKSGTGGSTVCSVLKPNIDEK